jgi:hypothetical protein
VLGNSDKKIWINSEKIFNKKYPRLVKNILNYIAQKITIPA